MEQAAVRKRVLKASKRVRDTHPVHTAPSSARRARSTAVTQSLHLEKGISGTTFESQGD
ncbi:rCG23279 [Rattus norvegicus]|uniref:RCG23279 n=1 Tax=Rattus norvegicus TaxID=10116 RepID=A6JQ87_RAT|nr:rCG23279 [Rattus norvegicus]